MRLNGLLLLINRAAQTVRLPLIDEYRHVIILGSLREDVLYVPGVGKVVEHLSFSHFYKPPLPGGFLPVVWPGARFKANRFFRHGLRHCHAGDLAAGFVQLGRAAHLLADMACPVHAHRIIHDTDLFEWYVESQRPELEALPLPEVPSLPSAGAVMGSMARFTARFPPDKTQHAVGRWLKRHGWLASVPRREIVQQAREIIPMAAAHMARLFDLFVTQARSGSV